MALKAFSQQEGIGANNLANGGNSQQLDGGLDGGGSVAS